MKGKLETLLISFYITFFIHFQADEDLVYNLHSIFEKNQIELQIFLIVPSFYHSLIVQIYFCVHLLPEIDEND